MKETYAWLRKLCGLCIERNLRVIAETVWSIYWKKLTRDYGNCVVYLLKETYAWLRKLYGLSTERNLRVITETVWSIYWRILTRDYGNCVVFLLKNTYPWLRKLCGLSIEESLNWKKLTRDYKNCMVYLLKETYVEFPWCQISWQVHHIWRDNYYALSYFLILEGKNSLYSEKILIISFKAKHNSWKISTNVAFNLYT